MPFYQSKNILQSPSISKANLNKNKSKSSIHYSTNKLCRNIVLYINLTHKPHIREFAETHTLSCFILIFHGHKNGIFTSITFLMYVYYYARKLFYHIAFLCDFVIIEREAPTNESESFWRHKSLFIICLIKF